jgi:hypothetical protein
MDPAKKIKRCSMIVGLLLRIMASLSFISRKLDKQDAKLNKIIALLEPEPAVDVHIDLGQPELKSNQANN